MGWAGLVWLTRQTGEADGRQEKISQFLTDTSAGRSTVTVEQFAQEFKMEPQDAEAYLLYINMMVSFKEQWMDPNAAGL